MGQLGGRAERQTPNGHDISVACGKTSCLSVVACFLPSSLSRDKNDLSTHVETAINEVCEKMGDKKLRASQYDTYRHKSAHHIRVPYNDKIIAVVITAATEVSCGPVPLRGEGYHALVNLSRLGLVNSFPLREGWQWEKGRVRGR